MAGFLLASSALSCLLPYCSPCDLRIPPHTCYFRPPCYHVWHLGGKQCLLNQNGMCCLGKLHALSDDTECFPQLSLVSLHFWLLFSSLLGQYFFFSVPSKCLCALGLRSFPFHFSFILHPSCAFPCTLMASVTLAWAPSGWSNWEACGAVLNFMCPCTPFGRTTSFKFCA